MSGDKTLAFSVILRWLPIYADQNPGEKKPQLPAAGSVEEVKPHRQPHSPPSPFTGVAVAFGKFRGISLKCDVLEKNHFPNRISFRTAVFTPKRSRMAPVILLS